MQTAQHLSPNHDSRENTPVSLLVLHYTGMQSANEARARMTDPSAKVSAHYMVEESGDVWQLVPEERRAWHAGLSHWRDRTNVNSASIGVEIVNPGHEFGYRAFPHEQMLSVAELCHGILARHPAIEPRNVVGHSDIAPARKEDPGELFDWAWLAHQGIGLWPQPSAVDEATIRQLQKEWHLPEKLREGDAGNGVSILQRGLQEYGYDSQITGLFDRATTQNVTAFQRHFRQEKVDGTWDVPCQARLETLLKMVAA